MRSKNNLAQLAECPFLSSKITPPYYLNEKVFKCSEIFHTNETHTERALFSSPFWSNFVMKGWPGTKRERKKIKAGVFSSIENSFVLSSREREYSTNCTSSVGGEKTDTALCNVHFDQHCGSAVRWFGSCSGWVMLLRIRILLYPNFKSGKNLYCLKFKKQSEGIYLIIDQLGHVQLSIFEKSKKDLNPSILICTHNS